MTTKNQTLVDLRIAGLRFVQTATATALCLSILRAQPEPDHRRTVELQGTEIRSLTSRIVEGQEYELQFSLPRYYADTTRVFPVVFVLDAQWDFSLVRSIYGSQYYDGFMPRAVIVGVTWGGSNPKHDSLRARDLTPANARQIPQSGGARKFLDCLKEEIIPFVESQYRVQSGDRTLMGSSFGGLFTLYAMLEETPLFQKYVLTSPALGWADQDMVRREESRAASDSRLTVRLFMAHGELEGGVPLFERFVQNLRSRDYLGLEIQTRVLEGAGHSGTKAEGYTRGLQFVFQRPSLRLSDEILDAYAGRYQLSPQFTVSLENEGGYLVGRGPDGSPVRMHAASEEEFYARGMYLNVKFQKDSSGRIVGIDAEQYGGKSFLKRVD